MRPIAALRDVFRELGRRRVYPVIAAYAVVAWILLQVGEVTFEPLGIPGWVMTALVILVIAGFPVALALSWVFDITPGAPRGIVRTDAVDAERRPSIAVLPFVDMSREQDQAYFCEGIAEEILNALVKIRQLRVAARTSAFQYRNEAVDVRKIGAALGVQTILEGSVRKSGNRLRITAQLVNVEDGYHVWSKSFDEELEDVFSIQDEIAKNIVRSLLETITPADEAAIKTTSSSDVQAYDYYLRGRQFINRFRKNDLEFAQQMFRQAIALDPDFALAWSGYADSFALLYMYSDPNERYCRKATEASKRAVELNPDLPEAHASRGLAYLVSEQYKKAEAEFENAIELCPHVYEAYYYYGRTRFHQGDPQGAAEWFRKAAEVSPGEYQSRCLRVQILRGTGRLEEASAEAREAIAVLEKHLAWYPDDVRGWHLGAGSLIVLGQVDRAKRWLKRALEIDPDDSIVLYNVACNYATLGENDKALDALEQAIENGVVSVAWMTADEDLASLRGHPRYEKMVADLEKQHPLGGDAA